jgi:hypothetical protein
LIFGKKPPTLIFGFSGYSHQTLGLHSNGTNTDLARHIAVGSRLGMALVVEIAVWPASGGYQRGAGKFQLLFSADHQSAGVTNPIVVALVVVSKVNKCE